MTFERNEIERLEQQNKQLKQTMEYLYEFISDVAEQLGMDTDGIGYDGLQLSIEDFKDKHLQAEVDRLKELLEKQDDEIFALKDEVYTLGQIVFLKTINKWQVGKE